MAKFLLNLFGGGSILIGMLIIIAGISTNNGFGASAGLYFGSGLLLFGAPLLGFARVIELLEVIATNTRSGSIEQATKDFAIKDRCRPYIKVRKPAFSNSKIYICDINGEVQNFGSEAEALAFVSSRLDASASSPAPLYPRI